MAGKQALGILIVDGEPDVRRVLARALEQEGLAVWQACSGPAALMQYQQHGSNISLVLLDVKMPGLDGPETLARLQKLNPAVRCCFMSGDLGRYTSEELLSLGAKEVLLKPFSLEALVEMVSRLLRPRSQPETHQSPLGGPT